MTSPQAFTHGPETESHAPKALSRSSCEGLGSEGFGGITPSLATRSTGCIKVLAVMLSALKKSVDLKNYDKCASKYRAGTLLVQYPALAITPADLARTIIDDIEARRSQCS